MNKTPRTNEWETYCDECYYHMWRIRRKNERGFDDGFHVQNGKEANQLVELLNKQDDELTAVTEQRDVAIKCHKWCYEDRKRIIEELTAVTEQREDLRKELEIANLRLKGERHPDDNGIMADGEIDVKALLDQQEQWRLSSVCRELVEQRDRLATILQNIRSGYGGQIPDPTCDCGDCEFLITIDNALQYLTKPNEQ
jgi:hypothetical protein